MEAPIATRSDSGLPLFVFRCCNCKFWTTVMQSDANDLHLYPGLLDAVVTVLEN